ncbi:MAG: hypothetical protein JST39_17150 [Bacteroidetes bacterium]|nr:hypothetical protein [Bacteroidota bacterium]
MKRIILPFLALLISVSLLAQPKAHEGTTDFQKTSQPAAIIELPYAEATVEKAVEEYMSKKGVRGADSRDFKVYRGYKMRSTHDHSSDLYFKAERKSRRDKDMCTLYLVIGKNGEDIKTRTDGGKASLDGATELLDDMLPAIEAYSLELQIKDQEELVKKNQKKYDNLVEDSVDYVKKMKSLQDKMDQNRKDRDGQQTELKKQSDILDVLRGKRKS